MTSQRLPSFVRPPEQVVHHIHDRFLVEIVEGLNLCPFARRCREQGRVHRPVWWVEQGQPTGADCAQRLHDVVAQHHDAEIVLLTFIVPHDHPWNDPETFCEFVPEVRQAYASLGGPGFFMVAFHPELGPRFSTAGAGTKHTPEALVPSLRRSPDPVIQCVRAELLEQVRAQAQANADERLRLRFADDPVMSALLARSIMADAELSSDIARHNFDAVGCGQGREELERRITELRSERDRHYAMSDEP